MTETLHCGTSGPADAERLSALERSPILLPDRKEGGVPGSSCPGIETDPAHAPPTGCRLPRSRDERRRLKLNAAKEKRRTLPTLQQFLGRLARPNLAQVIPTVAEVGCESPVLGAAWGGQQDDKYRCRIPANYRCRWQADCHLQSYLVWSCNALWPLSCNAIWHWSTVDSLLI